MSRADKLADFDPNAPGLRNAQIYGLPFNYEESKVVILPVPWEVTASYGTGAAKGPEAIREASLQVDLFSEYFPNAWRAGFFLLDTSADIEKQSGKLRPLVIEYLRLVEMGAGQDSTVPLEVNAATEALRKWVFDQTKTQLNNGKTPAVLGGEHAVSLGAMQALSSKYPAFGILQIDAHADLRPAYEGFEHSHASIMHNALTIKSVEKLIQVGIRDFSDSEAAVMESDPRILSFSEATLKRRQFEGGYWSEDVQTIIAALPEKVYISFDIDGLEPSLCPNTGTPVPGGLSFSEVAYLLKELVASGREIVGFDLCEVAVQHTSDWDANVGARVLYLLASAAANSQQMNSIRS